MIQFANNLFKKRSLYASQCSNLCYINKGQNLLYRQKNKYYSSSLKFSNFSDYMGLTQQFKQFCQNEEKAQKSQIRSYSVLIVICVTLIGYGSLLIFYDKFLSQKMKLMKLKLKISLNYKESKKHQLYSSYLNNISQFIKQNPYEYAQIIKKINDILVDVSGKNQQMAQIVGQANQIYKIIIKHNFKAANNKQVLEGIANIVQWSILNGQDVSKDLIMAIILNGSVKQIFLGVLHLYKHNELNELLGETEIKKDICTNLKKQIEITDKYFDHLDKSRDLQELPQFEFKREQQQKWQKFIQVQLDIYK